MSFLCQKEFKQTLKYKLRQFQTFCHNVILVSKSLQTHIEVEKKAIMDHLWKRRFWARKTPNRDLNWKRGNYRPFMIMSLLC